MSKTQTYNKLITNLFNISITGYVQDYFKREKGKEVGRSVLVTAINDKCSQSRIKMKNKGQL